jgi:hypothetical protein
MRRISRVSILVCRGINVPSNDSIDKLTSSISYNSPKNNSLKIDLIFLNLLKEKNFS